MLLTWLSEYCRASARSCFPSMRTHSVSVQQAHTHLCLSPRLLSFGSARTHTSFSLSASAQFLFSERTHISLSLSLSLHLLRFCSVRGREEQSLIQLNTDIMLLASLILHASIAKNHSTAIVITLWVFYLIRQQLYY